MKSIYLIGIFLLICFYSQAQSRKKGTRFTLDYAATLSAVTNPQYQIHQLRPTHNAFLKGHFYLNKKWRLTTGIGFLNARQYHQIYVGPIHGLNLVKTHRYYNYIIIPIGFDWKIGSFFLNPEIGFSYNIGFSEWKEGYDQLGKPLRVHQKLTEKPTNIIEAGIPILLSTGYLLDRKKYSYLIGVRTYFSMTNMVKPSHLDRHFFGAGIMAGIKM